MANRHQNQTGLIMRDCLATHVTVGFPKRDIMEMLEVSSRTSGFNFVELPLFWNKSKIEKREKYDILRSYLRSGMLQSDSVLLFTDAYDVLILEPAQTIVSKFFALKADIVFNAECVMWPTEHRDDVKAQFDENQSKWRYLNSGCYIGYVWAIEKLLDFAEDLFKDDTRTGDQAIAQDFYLKNLSCASLRIKIDSECVIFGSLLQSQDDFYFDRYRVFNRHTRHTTGILHANGDRNNELILREYFSLFLSSNGSRSLHLAMGAVGDEHLAYDKAQKILTLSKSISGNSVFFVARGEQRCVALTPIHNILTFTNVNTVHCGRTTIDDWERLNFRYPMESFHRVPLANYLRVPITDTLLVEPLPLAVLRQEFTAALSSLACSIERSI
jgi:hypothetical protein